MQIANFINNHGNNSNEENSEGLSGEPIKDDEKYTCYYADIDDDGTIDGIIFADLAQGNTGDGQWGNGWGNYEIPKKTGFKKYYIKNEEVTDDFGTLKVISPVKGSDGNERFYVMALDDFDESTHYWFYNAFGKLDNSVSSSEDDFGKGKENTETMIEEWNKDENGKYGEQLPNDMWGVIQKKDNDGKSKIEKGWFVPSKTEWAAFGGEVLEPLNIKSGNYADYGLSSLCWSSTQLDENGAYCALFEGGVVNLTDVNRSICYVRLATTF